MSYPARVARESAGLDLEPAARKLRVSAPYLAKMERAGGFPFILAERAAALYRCDLKAFLYTTTKGSGSLSGSATRGTGGRRTSRSPRAKASRQVSTTAGP